jgi:hypothetical protein
LQFEVVYFVTSPEFAVYTNAQQTINLGILERFRALGVSFMGATPTLVRLQDLRVVAADATEPAGPSRGT